MKTWTVEEMLAEGPCPGYDRDRIAALWAGRERLSLWDILMLDIPVLDRLWCSYRPGVLTAAQERDRTHRILRRTVETCARGCGIRATVEQWAEDWLNSRDRSAAWTAQAAWAAAQATEAAEAAEHDRQLQDLRAVLCAPSAGG